MIFLCPSLFSALWVQTCPVCFSAPAALRVRSPSLSPSKCCGQNFRSLNRSPSPRPARPSPARVCHKVLVLLPHPCALTRMPSICQHLSRKRKRNKPAVVTASARVSPASSNRRCPARTSSECRRRRPLPRITRRRSAPRAHPRCGDNGGGCCGGVSAQMRAQHR